jgi:hypothetical protein
VRRLKIRRSDRESSDDARQTAGGDQHTSGVNGGDDRRDNNNYYVGAIYDSSMCITAGIRTNPLASPTGASEISGLDNRPHPETSHAITPYVGISPTIARRRLDLERQQLRDFLAHWLLTVTRRPKSLELRAERMSASRAVNDGIGWGYASGSCSQYSNPFAPGKADRSGVPVRWLANRFRKSGGEDSTNKPAAAAARWGKYASARKGSEPTRANVLNMRRHWEKVDREGSSS